MSLVVNQNLMATNAARGLSNSFASLADSGQMTANDAGLRQITRAEIKSLDSPDMQPAAAAPETATTSGAQAASTGTSETQAAPMAPEQTSGSLLNTTDGGLANILKQPQMGMQSQNIQAQNANVMDMMKSTSQQIGDRLHDPMMDPSLSALSSQWDNPRPLLDTISRNSGNSDSGVEAIRSLFNANG